MPEIRLAYWVKAYLATSSIFPTINSYFILGSFFSFFPAKKRNSSSLNLVVSDLRARLGGSKVEKVLFLRLNKSSTKFLGLGRSSESWKT